MSLHDPRSEAAQDRWDRQAEQDRRAAVDEVERVLMHEEAWRLRRPLPIRRPGPPSGGF